MLNKTKTPEFQVPPHIRFTGAWSEINQRLSIRSLMQTAHLTIVVTVAGAIATLSTPITGSVTREGLPAPIDTEMFSTGELASASVVLISVIFVLWQLHNELIIGALTGYCEKFEEADYKYRSKEIPTHYYSASPGTGLLDRTLKYRRLSDVATAFICSISPLVLYFRLDFMERWTAYTELLFGGCLVVAGGLVALVWRIPILRAKTRNVHYDSLSGKWGSRRIFID